MNFFNRLNLSQKLILSMLLMGIIPMAVVGFLAERAATSSIRDQAFAQLESIRSIKGDAIKRHFTNSHNLIESQAFSTGVRYAATGLKQAYKNYLAEMNYSAADINAMREQLRTYYANEFGAKYRNINGKAADIDQLLNTVSDTGIALQFAYIQANPHPLGEKHNLINATISSPYADLHAEVHAAFVKRLEDFGYYDIFMVDPDTGDIFYSVFKELDYATSLYTGPYADTNFAAAVKGALIRDTVYTEDFKPYTPSYEAPASFMAMQIKDGEQIIAVLVYQLPIEPINEIMTSRDGMGETGESYLVGSDLLMRSDSYLDPENHSVSGSFSNPQLGSIKTTATRNAFKGISNTEIIIDYNGNPVLSSYASIDLGDFKWAIIAEIDKAEALEPVNSLIKTVLSIAAVAAVIIVFLAFKISSSIANPIISLVNLIKRVQARGDFSVRSNSHANDEIGQASSAFDQLTSSLQKALAATNNTLKQVSDGHYVPVEGEYVGEIAELQLGVNSALENIEKANNESEQQRKIAAKNAAETAQKAEEASIAAEQAKEAAVVASRLKQALDNVSTGAMVADVNYNIIYLNKALSELFHTAQADLQKVLPRFDVKNLIGQNIDIFHKNPAHQRGLLENLKAAYASEMEIAGYTFGLVANPIIADDGQRIGTVVEWKNRTEEVAVEKEIDSIIDKAAAGDLSNRVEEQGKAGFFLSVSKGLNSLLDIAKGVIDDTSETLSALAQGDLSRKITSEYQGAFDMLKQDANTTVDKLTEVITKINSAADQVTTGADEIAQGNADLSQRTEEQASSLEQTASSMEQMTSTVRQNADNAKDANVLADEASRKAQQGGEVVGNAIESMEAINESSKKINDIIGVIDEIAFQTNLLALNAAVEAARAGEQGRGFAVVAGEVRNLAQRSAAAAKEIKELIRDSVSKVEDGSNLVNQSGETLHEIVESVAKVSQMIANIAAASEEQTSGIEQVNKAISQMDSMTQQNAALVEEATAASESVAEEGRNMRQLLGFFKV